MAPDTPAHRILVRLKPRLGSEKLIELLTAIYEPDSSNWKLSHDYGPSVLAVTVLRSRPDLCLRAVIDYYRGKSQAKVFQLHSTNETKSGVSNYGRA